MAMYIIFAEVSESGTNATQKLLTRLRCLVIAEREQELTEKNVAVSFSYI